jgi:DNA-directed RNA polymerase specialized sigma24 family protein
MTRSRKLPGERRNAFIAVYIEDQDPAEYAAAHGLARKTVYNHLDLARRDIRRQLSDYASETCAKDGRNWTRVST